MTDTMSDSHVLTPVEVERMIGNSLRRLDEATHEYADINHRAAEAEAAYRKAQAMKTLALLKHGTFDSAKERDARIDLECSDEREVHLLTEAARNSAREHLNTLRTRIEALRTISASVRGQT